MSFPDKPLALNADEGRKLRDAAIVAKVAHVVTFNYRGNPLVQQVRGIVARGETGPMSFIHGYYLQDWMTDPNVYSWRSDPAKGGVTSALGDIGSHWCDLAEHVSGLNIVSVLADLTTVVPVRYSSGVFLKMRFFTSMRRTHSFIPPIFSALAFLIPSLTLTSATAAGSSAPAVMAIGRNGGRSLSLRCACLVTTAYFPSNVKTAYSLRKKDLHARRSFE
jgi:hypothetical protein